MAFLVVSTAICLVRNAPKMMRDAQSFREYVRASSLRSFHHRVEAKSPAAPAQSLVQMQQWLTSQGDKFKVRQEGDSSMLAAKKGSAKRLISEDRSVGKECVSTGRSRWWTAH